MSVDSLVAGCSSLFAGVLFAEFSETISESASTPMSSSSTSVKLPESFVDGNSSDVSGLDRSSMDLISSMARDSHFIDELLFGDVDAVLPLLQSAFLYLLDHHLIPPGLAPLVPSRVQYFPCLIKSFARMTGANMKCENIPFAVLNFFSGGMIQIGNLFPYTADLPIGFVRRFLTQSHQMLRLANTAFGGSHVRLTYLREAIDAMQALFLIIHVTFM
jgi:hypothetical protein